MEKKYIVGFIGSSSTKIIYAKNEKEAKKIFADIHNINVSNYIVIHIKNRGV